MEDLDKNKLFCGGIPRETTEQMLKEHFSKYGTVVSSVIAKDRETGRPRGFAFVSFSDSSAVDKALQDTHEILGRMVEVKKAIPRSEQHQQQSQQQQQQNSRGLNWNSRTNGRSNDQFRFRTKKIFVGGLSANLTKEDFKSYFERFGRITDVVVMHDNVTHRPRGFGFITFDSEDAVEEVMQKNFHELSGKLVEVKRAIPKDENSNSSNGYHARIGNGSGSNYNTYQQGMYPSYSPRYVYCCGPVSGYGNVAGYPYGVATFGGNFPAGAYPGIGYGIASLVPPGPWNNPTMTGLRGSSPLPYGNTGAIYPTYMNGGIGVMGVATNGYGGILGAGVNEKSGQVSVRDVQRVSD
ncbi:PREDICTED: RNA-binding protein 1 [Nicotiana attenuata]|uniref:Rna-binding protein 1 n=1 Tax=Nicotiana attenuata TaxID=49451 RepID=A0A314KKW8_NICAT|nr:PREDICTED: RNA-binding protein 1 [Nicotiana attenuata]OIT29822.1 rna-binding protein 1 [Nicotiana attenuata]